MPSIFSKIPDQVCFDILTTAIEGGSNYWLNDEDVRNIRIDRAGIEPTRIQFESNIDGKAWKSHDIGPAQLREVIEKVAMGTIVVHEKRQATFARLIHDEADYDAEDADVMLQLAAFGDIIYG